MFILIPIIIKLNFCRYIFLILKHRWVLNRYQQCTDPAQNILGTMDYIQCKRQIEIHILYLDYIGTNACVSIQREIKGKRIY